MVKGKSQWKLEIVQSEQKKYTYQNVWDAAKNILKGHS